MGRGPVLRTPDDWDGGCTQLLSSGPGPAYQDRNQPPHSHTTSEPGHLQCQYSQEQEFKTFQNMELQEFLSMPWVVYGLNAPIFLSITSVKLFKI